ncbi:MAG: 4-(cytidine 5'-diphospho)-2-C-methyl-D-erythritol kinase [Actinomycetaceae bacterium]|nr:4-(cytidine 5'-diphospho)-2-C-methyl-D-erythritol kinase [Actinomycetaceae bacterium]
MTRRVIASAPGKVNLVLWSGRPDMRGYHPLYSIFETLHMRETVMITANTAAHSASPSACEVSIRTVVDVADAATNSRVAREINSLDPRRNLAWKAVDAVRKLVMEKGGYAPGAAIEIRKTIPVAGGMAGGSADAAAALIAANEFFQAQLDAETIHQLARSLGADVPTCVAGGLNIGFGYGDHITRLDTPATPTHHWVMVLAYEGLSTPAVFREFDRRGEGRSSLPQVITPLHSQIAMAPAETLADLLDNDLENISRAMRSDLEATFDAIKATDAVGAVLSGSGPTIAVLARDETHAHSLSQELEGEPSVAQTIVTSGPAEPARLEDR